MTTGYHSTLKEIQICADWQGRGAKIVLAKKGGGFYCLWGDENQSEDELTPVKCITPAGQLSGLGGSLKLFYQMVNATKVVKIKSNQK